jgi:hypothetical protein
MKKFLMIFFASISSLIFAEKTLQVNETFQILGSTYLFENETSIYEVFVLYPRNRTCYESLSCAPYPTIDENFYFKEKSYLIPKELTILPITPIPIEMEKNLTKISLNKIKKSTNIIHFRIDNTDKYIFAKKHSLKSFIKDLKLKIEKNTINTVLMVQAINNVNNADNSNNNSDLLD